MDDENLEIPDDGINGDGYYSCPLSDGDNERHEFKSVPVDQARFIHGNADCFRVTRIMLFCKHCGYVKFVSDPNQPVLKSRNDVEDS